MKTENSESLVSIAKSESGIEIMDDLELVELKGGAAGLDINLSGLKCPNYSGNCVSGCDCSTPDTNDK